MITGWASSPGPGSYNPRVMRRGPGAASLKFRHAGAKARPLRPEPKAIQVQVLGAGSALRAHRKPFAAVPAECHILSVAGVIGLPPVLSRRYLADEQVGDDAADSPGPLDYALPSSLRRTPAYSMARRLGVSGASPRLGVPGPGAYDHECVC